MTDFLTWLGETPFSIAIAEGETLFPWIESFHVMAIVVVVGTVAVIDLRLVGVAAHRKGIRSLARELLPVTWAAFAVALCTGLLMFSAKPLTYAENIPFLIKLGLLVLAALNMLFFHFVTERRIEGWDEALVTPKAARFAGYASLLLWIAVVFAGRWIGFTTV